MNARKLASVVLLLPILASPLAGQSYAVDRGSLRIGGNASFSSTGTSVNGTDEDDRLTQLAIAPQIEFFVVPGLALGGELVLSRLSDGDDSFTAYGLGPAITYFFGSGPRSVWPFIGGSLQFQWASSDGDDDPSIRGYRGEAGALFMASDAVGFDAAFYYQFLERESDLVDVESDSFGLAIGVSAFIF